MELVTNCLSVCQQYVCYINATTLLDQCYDQCLGSFFSEDQKIISVVDTGDLSFNVTKTIAGILAICFFSFAYFYHQKSKKYKNQERFYQYQDIKILQKHAGFLGVSCTLYASWLWIPSFPKLLIEVICLGYITRPFFPTFTQPTRKKIIPLQKTTIPNGKSEET